MGKVGGCELIGLLLCLGGVTLAAVAVATPYWTSTTNYYQGLWKTCSTTSGVTTCTNIGLNFGDDMIMTISRIAFFVGFFFVLIAFLVGACGLCKKDSRQGSVAAMGGLYITAGLLFLIASGVYLAVSVVSTVISNAFASATGGSSSELVNINNWGYSMWMAWASFVACFIGGIWLCCASCQIKKRQVTIVPVAVPPQAHPAPGTSIHVTTANPGYY